MRRLDASRLTLFSLSSRDDPVQSVHVGTAVDPPAGGAAGGGVTFDSVLLPASHGRLGTSSRRKAGSMVGDSARQGQRLRRIALGVAAVYVLVGVMFIAGETFTDPGGWAAVGLTAAWLVPMVGLGWLGLRHADVALVPLTAVTGAVVVLSLVAAVMGGHWSTFENHHGPLRAIVVFVLCGVLAAFGFRRPKAGGVLLLVGSVVPALLGIVTGGPGTAALPLVAVPGVVVGILYLESGARPRQRRPA